jgi:hypothetical protein
MDTETYGAMLDRWRHTQLANLAGETANACLILHTINGGMAPLTPARKAAIIAADACERLQAERDALLVACEAALAMHDRYCDRVGAADGWARSTRQKLQAAIRLARGEA